MKENFLRQRKQLALGVLLLLRDKRKKKEEKKKKQRSPATSLRDIITGLQREQRKRRKMVVIAFISCLTQINFQKLSSTDLSQIDYIIAKKPLRR